MEYKEAVKKAKEYALFIDKQLHIEEFKEKITIKKVYLCELVHSKTKGSTMRHIKPLEGLDLKKDNSEKLKGMDLDVIIVYEKSNVVEDLASNFNSKYPLL